MYASDDRYQPVSSTTDRPTSSVTPATCFVLMLRGNLLLGFFFGLYALQLVVERLEADAEHLGGPGLVALRVIERHVDQLALGFVDRRARRETDCAGRLL